MGLDPIQIIEIRDLIKELGQTHTVVFSSHILSEVQAICDQILIISKGKLVAFGAPEELERRLLAPDEISLAAEASPDIMREILSGVEHLADISVQPQEDGLCTARLKTDGGDIRQTARAVFFAFARRETALLELSVKKANLEELFLELTDDAAPGSAESEGAKK